MTAVREQPPEHDEEIARLRAALELVGEDPQGRALINADLADVHAWRYFVASRQSGADDTASIARDAAIEFWRQAALAATDAGTLAELVTHSPITVLDQVELLTGRAMAEQTDADFTDAIELAGRLVDALPEGDQARDDALFGRGLAYALRYDRWPVQPVDLHAAIRDFRELWLGISEDHPLYPATAVWLGVTLAARARPDDAAYADHVTVAVDQLMIATRLPADPDDPGFAVARIHLGVLLTVRYLYLAGDATVRDAALAALHEALESAGADPFLADACHLGLALLALAGSAPERRFRRPAPEEPAITWLWQVAGEAGRENARRHLESLTKHAMSCLPLAVVRPPVEEPGVDEIIESVARFGDGHPMRNVLLTLLDTTELPREVGAELLENALRLIPDDHPKRESTLTILAPVAGRAIVDGQDAFVDSLHALLTDVVARKAVDQANEAVNHYLLAIVITAKGLANQDADLLTDAIRRMRNVAELAPAGHWTLGRAEAMLSAMLNVRWIAGAELEYLDAAVYHSAGRAASGAADPAGAAAHHIDVLTTSLLAQVSSGSTPASQEVLASTIAELEREGARLPDEDTRRSDAAVLAKLAKVHLDGREHGFYSAAARSSAVSFGQVAEAVTAQNVRDPYTVAARGGGRITSAFAQRNLELLDQGIADLASASTSPSFEARERAMVLHQLGLAFCLRYELTKRVRDLSVGIDRMEEADRHFRHQPGGVVASLAAMSLADAYHVRGDKALRDRDRAVATGLRALRDHAVDVRLQSGTRRAMDKAATAAGEAVKVARWCLAAGQPLSAVTALELGRAMVVHVATSDPSVPAALRARGADELATEWEESTQDSGAPWDVPLADLVQGATPALFADLASRPVPNDLRRRALRVIGEDADPPTVAEIAATLCEARTAALVYLLPRGRIGRGMALVVDQDGRLTELRLPNLDTSGGTRLREHGARVAAEVCDWAWRVAMADVVATVKTGPRPPRIVIVPVGGLTVVPWHAARQTVSGGGPRYACHDVIISYAASARQFVDASRRPSLPWQSAPGLVRVANSTLYWASREIEEIRARYYPDATYLGGHGRRARSGRRPATRENVRALLPGLDTPGASMIHLGCHAYLADPPIESYLSLTDGPLRVGDMLDQARRRPVDAPGGLVVLAACASDASDGVHDESLSLATGFLAAGAGGVVGARWAVDDVPTAAFMIMFHHYLNSGYADPATAVRAAQRWMLNPDRRLPAGFDRVLADELARLDLTEVTNWAAFTYQGR